MKKWIVLLLAVLCLSFAGCARDMNWVIGHEPSVRGLVEDFDGHWVTLRLTEGEQAGSLVYVQRETRLQDCKFSASVGDEVQVYYADTSTADGRIEEVHGYLLIEPAERETE